MKELTEKQISELKRDAKVLAIASLSYLVFIAVLHLVGIGGLGVWYGAVFTLFMVVVEAVV